MRSTDGAGEAVAPRDGGAVRVCTRAPPPLAITHISTCEAHGNLFRITAPVIDTLTTDGCYDEEGKELVFEGPFPAGTKISAEAQAPPLKKAPSLKVEGSYPEWTLHFEDGVDNDFDDLTFTLTALPVPAIQQ